MVFGPCLSLTLYFLCFCVFQVLFWGLRELKRVELFEVSRPMVRMECGGRQLESEEVENFKIHPNFKELVGYIDVVSLFYSSVLLIDYYLWLLAKILLSSPCV